MAKRDLSICSLTGLPQWLASKISVEPMTGCWLWIGARSKGERCGGYGSVLHDGASRQAHRVVWEHLHGVLDDGLTLDHVKSRGCASILCCNPWHLEPVTRSVNNARSTCHHHAAFRANIGRLRRSHKICKGLAHAWAKHRDNLRQVAA